MMAMALGAAITLAFVLAVLFGVYNAELISNQRERFSSAGRARKRELEKAEQELNAARQELRSKEKKIEGYKAEGTYEGNAFRSFIEFETEVLHAACRIVGLNIEALQVTRSSEYVGSTEVHRLEFDNGLSAEISMDGEYFIKISGQEGLEDLCIGLNSDGNYTYTLSDVKNVAQYMKGTPQDKLSAELDITKVIEHDHA